VEQAWFERGEALLALGRPNEAVEAYRRVVEMTRGDTQTSIRARRRILEILTGAVSRSNIGVRQDRGHLETGPSGPVYAGQPQLLSR
jgi:hypothetical protein